MNDDIVSTGASVIPTVRYRDLTKAVAWLQEAFGFEPHRVVKDSKGAVLYAQLTFGTGMVMAAPIQESAFGKLMVQPDEIGGVETQICYLFVDDAKAHYARAKAAGAEIVLDIEGAAIGGRGYSCRDPEGHVWNFGTHNPWASAAVGRNRDRTRRTWKALAACLLIAGAGGFFAHKPSRDAASDFASAAFGKISAAIEPAQAEQTPDRESGNVTDRALSEMREHLAKERQARLAADRQVDDLAAQLTQEHRAREAAELAVRNAAQSQAPVTDQPTPGVAPKAVDAEARSDLAKARGALKTAAEQLAQAQKARENAERTAKEARDELVQLRGAKQAAEHTARELRDLAVRERKTRIAAQRTLRRAKASPYTPYPLN